MANYDYKEYEGPLEGRFPGRPDISGGAEWIQLVQEPTLQNLDRLRDAGFSTTKRACPRLFVSHRQIDVKEAERIAWLACNEQFEYWIDIYDPALVSLPQCKGLSNKQIALLTAGIIEMALINCTHVMAAMTLNAPGSMWIPYEYGRITDLPTTQGRAAAWVHKQSSNIPEYLYLGIITVDEPEIRKWLRDEFKKWSGGGCSCSWGTKPVPPALP
jgi:hypothetical protein